MRISIGPIKKLFCLTLAQDSYFFRLSSIGESPSNQVYPLTTKINDEYFLFLYSQNLMKICFHQWRYQRVQIFNPLQELTPSNKVNARYDISLQTKASALSVAKIMNIFSTTKQIF